MAIALIFATLLIFLLYKYSVRNFNYWERRGIPYVKPLPFVGSVFEVFSGNINIGFYLAKWYKRFGSPYFGIFILNRPYLVIKDPDIIKRVLVQDFDYFCNRTISSNVKIDPIGAHILFLVKNPEWKFMRDTTSLIYTSRMAKRMIPLMNAVADDLKTYVDACGSEFSMDAKRISVKFVVDVIAMWGFGVKANCFKSNNAQFEELAQKIFCGSGLVGFRQFCYFLIPSFVDLFKMPFLDPSVSKFMKEVVTLTIKEREGSIPTRNDVIDILMKIRLDGLPEDPVKFEGDIAVSQAAQFYAAGLETTSSTMSFILYEFCMHPEIQDKVRSEIRCVVTQHGGFTYEAMQDMKYLRMVVLETLRKYSVLPFLDRTCMKDYKVAGSDFVIEKGTAVYIPIYGLHNDPEYFPDPEKFDPERFSPQNKGKLPNGLYLPFGEGPRICIGQRFGMSLTMLGLAHLLSVISVELNSETPIPITYHPMGFLLRSTVGLPMKFKRNPLFPC